MLTYAVLSRLLLYPEESGRGELDEMEAILRSEGLLAEETRMGLVPLFEELRDRDLIELGERYNELFDRTRSLSLHLFEHLHGESRDRGQAMVELLERYEAQGLRLAVRELPDYLPLFLEYLSQLPGARAAAELAETAAVLAAIRRRLEKRGSPYAALFACLEELAARAPGEKELSAVPEELDDDPYDLTVIDRHYAEEPATFVGTPRQVAIGGCFVRRGRFGAPAPPAAEKHAK